MSMEQLKVNYVDGEVLKADDINKINETINNIITNSKIDQKYSASSTNAQSGKAVAEAIDNMKNDILGEGTTETFDTLKEIEDWIEKQGGSAVELTLAINNEAKAREDKDKELQDQIDIKFDEEQVNDAIETALAGYDPIDEDQLVGKKTPEGGEIFNDYENNKAGIKGFRILDTEFIEGSEYYNENLIPFPYYFMETPSSADDIVFDGTLPFVKEMYGVTVTVNEDRSIVLNGTSTASYSIHLCFMNNLELDETKTYTLSGDAVDSNYPTTYSLGFDGGDLGLCGTYSNFSDEVWYKHGAPLDIQIWGPNVVCDNVIFKPKFEEGAEATSFYPSNATKLICKLETSTEGLEVGDVPSVWLNQNCIDVGDITQIENNKVTITIHNGEYDASHFMLKSNEVQTQYPWYNTLVVNKKPTVGNIVVGKYTHADGYNTKAMGPASHAEGIDTLANGEGAHAGGIGTIAENRGQMAVGRYNDPTRDDDPNTSPLLFMIGNGTSDAERHNAVEVRENGQMMVANSITIGGIELTPEKLSALLALLDK